MRTLHWIIGAVFVVGVSPAAQAQTRPGTPATPATTTSSPDTTSSGWWPRGDSHWTAAGFVGANYGRNVSSAGADFGGQVAYLYRGILGGEFLADFSPRFKEDNLFFAESPNVNAYMANVIGAVPIGSGGMFQPFLSGGIGGIQMRSQILNIATFPSSGSNAVSNTKLGTDIGGGVMWFAGRVGVRADVRYYRAFSGTSTLSSTATAAEVFSQGLLPGLDFWRSNIGIAFRW